MLPAQYVKAGILLLFVLWMIFLVYLAAELIKSARKRAANAEPVPGAMVITGRQIDGNRITVPVFQDDRARFTGVAFVSMDCGACETLLQSLLVTRLDSCFIRMLVMAQDGLAAERLRWQKAFQSRQPGIIFLVDSAGQCFNQMGLRSVPVFRLYDRQEKRLIREFQGDINLPDVLRQTSKQSRNN